MVEAEPVVTDRFTLGEGPVWDDRASCLYFTDIRGYCYFRFEPESGHLQRNPIGALVGAVGLREAGGVLLATSKGVGFFDPGQETPFVAFADPEHDKADSRFNDGAADPGGRYWVGSFGAESNTLYRLDPDRRIQAVEGGFGGPNGIAWSPDGATMYFTDSPAKTIYSYRFDDEDGTIRARKVFVRDEESGVPDGLTVDREGFVWSARFDGGRLDRYDPSGRLVGRIRLPVSRPTSMTFGGPELDVLYVTSAKYGLSESELRSQPLAGALLRIELGITGRLESRFAG